MARQTQKTSSDLTIILRDETTARDARGLHVLVKHGETIPSDRPAIAADGGPYTQRGQTAHFVVYYENALGANGPVLADAVLASCEGEFQQLQGWFGGITPGNLPFHVYV